jgi:hypothetical protein
MKNKTLRQSGIDEIVAESEEFACEWRRQTFRIGVSIVIGALLSLFFSPETVEGYLATSLLIAPTYLIAAKEPKSVRMRAYACLACIALSLTTYFALVA